ncbi:MAG TPA: sigma-70 family RNA polymerase sigma factor [Pyrinomonadaceae bacterium]
MSSARNLAGSSGTRSGEQVNLIQRIACGDQHALSSLYDTTNRLMYGLVLRILKDTGAAEEVMLDVYTQVWRQAAQYNDRRGTPMAWLTTIARSRAIDRLRAGHAQYLRDEPLDLTTQTATTENLEEALAMRETQRTVRTALGQISPEQREVIELAYYSGLSHSEIAAQLAQPLGTVKTRIRLGMMRLRELLKGTHEADK